MVARGLPRDPSRPVTFVCGDSRQNHTHSGNQALVKLAWTQRASFQRANTTYGRVASRSLSAFPGSRPSHSSAAHICTQYSSVQVHHGQRNLQVMASDSRCHRVQRQSSKHGSRIVGMIRWDVASNECYATSRLS
ncbi:hypothetical protein BD414DRAFT_260580 [Trametes punicea]|nr:hypothetical protein BD414DRAFT_260580 [Trametes punicea]